MPRAGLKKRVISARYGDRVLEHRRQEIERDSRGILNPGLMREHVEFTRVAPPDELGGLVDWFWAVRWTLPGSAEFVQPVLAHPSANLSAGPAYTRGEPRDDIEATLVGVQTAIDRRRLRGTGWNVAAKLRPGALGLLLGRSAGDLTDSTVSAAEVLGARSASLEARVADLADDVPAQVGELEAALRVAIDRVSAQRRAAAAQVVWAAGLVEADRSIRSVAMLADRVGHSVRTLQRLFIEYAGVSPMWMIRRCRLIEAADAARAGRPGSWSELAAGLGYADHAHLIREFKAVVGMTPAAYAASVVPLRCPPDAEAPRAV
ncbi:helix-turn-helix domain-containing protein [Cumulibacter soli]|uniref:helix-turn-helix domain-containing protein n=1 Tax=Cumulibacter soli TaxID=2546344 RepID=UPI0014197865|nr:AraC family transcriptional regulator [Cumulibacter soli]